MKYRYNNDKGMGGFSASSMLCLVLCAFAFVLTSCDSFLDIQPTGKVIAKTGEEYRNVLTATYNEVPRTAGLATFRSDEFWLDHGVTQTEDLNSFVDIWLWRDDNPAESTTTFEWRVFYHVIYISNYIISHQNEITEVKQKDLKQMVGEAYMLRAFAYFQLVNLYAAPYTHCDPQTAKAVPLTTDTDLDAVLPRSTVAQVYDRVLADIATAETYLNVDEWEEGLNYRFNTLSAKCLRARALLYMGRYADALAESEAILQVKNELQPIASSPLPSSYNSKESILALEWVMPTAYQKAGRIAPSFLALYRTGDQRKSKYFKQITSSISELVKGGTNDYRCTFRVAEFYLTAAECAARTSDRQKAIEKLTVLMKDRYVSSRANTYIEALNSMTDEQLLNEILDERARELAFEGHRWFDLRRTTQPAITHSYQETGSSETIDYVLAEGDPRYTIRIPSAAVSANPMLAE